MAAWLSYSLADFIPFSPEAYLRLFERYHADIWPLQLLGWVAGLGLLWLFRRRRAVAAAALLAACWLWTGLVFQRGYYAELNWAAGYFGWAFAVQGLLLATAGFTAKLEEHTAAPALIGLAVIGHPLFVAFSGGNTAWYSAGLFATAPDPTAVATLGLTLAVQGWRRWLLAALPALWCGLGLLMALGLERPALGAAAGAGLVLWAVFSVWPGHRRPIE